MSRLNCPAPDILQEALHPSALDNVDLCEHLASCQTCRAKLESIAGESSWWENARQTLASPKSEATLRIVSSVCALSDGAIDPATENSLLQHELEQLGDHKHWGRALMQSLYRISAQALCRSALLMTGLFSDGSNTISGILLSGRPAAIAAPRVMFINDSFIIANKDN